MMKGFPGDYVMFHKCRIECKKKILENKEETDPIKIQDLIFFGEEIRDMIETNLMQVGTMTYTQDSIALLVLLLLLFSYLEQTFKNNYVSKINFGCFFRRATCKKMETTDSKQEQNMQWESTLNLCLNESLNFT